MADNPSELDTIKEWSSTHHRLRTELFICAVLIAATAWLGVDLKHLPFTNTALDTPAPRVLILAALYAMFLFFLGALWWRARVENLRSGPPDKLFAQFIQTLEARLHEPPPLLSVDDASLRSFDKTAKTILQQIKEEPTPAPKWNDVQVRPWTTDEVGQLDEYNRSIAMSLLMPEYIPKDEQASELALSYLAPLQAALQTLGVSYDQSIASRFPGFHDALEGLRRQLLHTEEQIQSAEENILGTVEHYTNQVLKSQNKMRAELNLLRAEIGQMRDDIGIERNFFSLWAPIIGSCTIAYSHPIWVLGNYILDNFR